MLTLAVEPPPAFVAGEVAQPVLSQASGSRFTAWRATRSEPAGETLLAACAATPIPGWVDDMRASVDARTTGLTSAAGERMVGAPLEAHPDGKGGLLLLAPGGGATATEHGIARTFIGFDGHDLVTCFAACTSRAPVHRGGSRTCDASVASARVEGGTEPPRPGLVLGSVTWAVHHPARTASCGAVLVAALGTLAVVARRRPRSRI
ncbi:MAG: hypothetical protein KF819_12890 [Labilithrix sp.]|nr:hypothetical protein [Labilithrix sp.]